MAVLRKIFQKIKSSFILFDQMKNWYLPNNFFIFKNNVILNGKIPACNQAAIISGMGKTTIGVDCEFGYKMGGRHRGGSVELQSRYRGARIVIADKVLTNNNVFICAANSIEIGKASLIGEGVTIMDHEAHGIEPNKRREIGDIGYVKIGANVWIGNNAIILKNTEIGDNTIVAAGAIVSGLFPANVIIGGVPAKLIRHL